jgi:phosphatidylserine/phosphatidylglycerophosphate/cardiolipin synthase-like enzyme
MEEKYNGKSSALVREEGVLESLEAYIATPEDARFLSHLTISWLKNAFEAFVRSKASGGLAQKILMQMNAILKEETDPVKASLLAIEHALKMLSKDPSISRHERSWIGKWLQDLVASPQPLKALCETLGHINRLNYWDRQTEDLHLCLRHHFEGMELTDAQRQRHHLSHPILALYKAMGDAIMPSFARALPESLRFGFVAKKQAELDSLLIPNTPKLGETSHIPHSGIVCRDSKEGYQWKLRLIREAQNNIVMSGCYLGGRALDAMLDLMKERLEDNEALTIVITGVETMLTTSNLKRITALAEKYPERFKPVITSEVFGVTNPFTEQFGLTSNHIKYLGIDGGRKFLIGGSGTQDGWADFAGDEDVPVAGRGRDTLPRAYRDNDFIFSCPQEGSIGSRLHIIMMRMIQRFSSIKEAPEGLSEAFTDPLHILEGASGAMDEPALSEYIEEIQMAAYLTGPDEADNPFQKDLIEAIKHAKKRILISHMYIHPSQELMQALIDATNRGVNVIIISNANSSTMPMTHELYVPFNRLCLRHLMEQGTQNRILYFEWSNPHVTYHKKVIVIDPDVTEDADGSNIVFTGSSNLGHKSLQGHIDYECNLRMHSQKVATTLMGVLANDMKASRQVPPKELLEMSLGQQAWGSLIGAVASPFV